MTDTANTGYSSGKRKRATLIPVEPLLTPATQRTQQAQPTATLPNTPANQWDYLLNKYAPSPGDKELPPLGESDHEDYDNDPEYDQPSEADASEAEEEAPTKALPPDEVLALIDSYTASFKKSWSERKMRTWESAASALWREHHQKPPQVQLVALQQTQARIQQLEQRLQFLKERIRSTVWLHPDEIKRSCGSLEATIQDLLVDKWQLTTWCRSERPGDVNQEDMDGEGVERDRMSLTATIIETAEPLSRRDSPTTPILPSKAAVKASVERQPHSRPRAHKSSRSSASQFARAPRANSQATAQVIDLTNSPPPPEPPHPEEATVDQIREWSMGPLIVSRNSPRVLMKVISLSSPAERDTIRNRFSILPKLALLDEVKRCLKMMAAGEERMLGVPNSDLSKIVAVTRLFLCYWDAQDYMTVHASDPAIATVANNLRANSPDIDWNLEQWYDYCCNTLPKFPTVAQMKQANNKRSERKTVSSKRSAPFNPTNIITLSSDEND